MTYTIEQIYSVRVNEREWTKQYPDITFVDIDCEYMGDDMILIRDTLTMEIQDWWIVEEYGYFCT